MLQRKMADLYDETMARECSLKYQGWHVESIWECQYKGMKAQDESLRDYAEQFGVPPPLNPRDAFMGGRTNATQLICEAPPGAVIRYYDINR